MLGTLGVKQLAYLLRCGHMEQHDAAKAELRRRPLKEAKPILSEMLQSPDRWLRELGVRGIWCLDPVDLDLLEPLLFDPDSSVAATASWAFGKGEHAKHRLVSIAKNARAPEHVRELCVNALALHTQDAFEALFHLSQIVVSSCILAAILRALPRCMTYQVVSQEGELTPKDLAEKERAETYRQQAVAMYQAALSHPSPDVRLAAAEHLIDNKAGDAERVLREVLNTSFDPEHRLLAASILSRHLFNRGVYDSEVTGHLIEGISGNPGNRSWRVAQSELHTALYNESVRRQFLLYLAGCQDPKTRLVGLQVLRQFQPVREVYEAYIHALWDADKAIRQYVLENLKYAQNPRQLLNDLSHAIEKQAHASEEVGDLLVMLLEKLENPHAKTA